MGSHGAKGDVKGSQEVKVRVNRTSVHWVNGGVAVPRDPRGHQGGPRESRGTSGLLRGVYRESQGVNREV